MSDNKYFILILTKLVLTFLYLSLPLQSTGLPQQSFMHVAPGSMSYSSDAGGGGGGGATSQALAAATAALADSGILSSPHTHLHRHINSPQRPPSTGNTGVCACVCFIIQEGRKRIRYLSYSLVTHCVYTEMIT